MIKVDLHTHSIASPDGSITTEQYKKILGDKTLDCIAITDHNSVDLALSLQKELGSEKIIIGEEISTTQGEIIGLFLKSKIEPNQDIKYTIEQIKQQGGIVYIPHPFETVRSGITKETLETIREDVDIIESANGRAFFQNFGPQAHTWAHVRNVPTFASSDGHRPQALGKTYTLLNEVPALENLLDLVKGSRKFYSRPSMLDILAPKLNRIKKFLKIL